MKKSLIIGLIFIVICVSLVFYNELKSKKSYSTNLHDITNSGSKKENEKVYLDATFIAGLIKFNNQNFYVFFGDGVQYLVSIDDTKALEINRFLLNNPEDSYRITGVTKLIPDEIADDGMKFVKEWMESNHEDGEEHSHDITRDDFYHYFGHVYLEVSNNSNIFMLAMICIAGVTGVLFILNGFMKKYQLI